MSEQHGPVAGFDAVVDAHLGEERPRLEAERLDHDEHDRERDHAVGAGAASGGG